MAKDFMMDVEADTPDTGGSSDSTKDTSRSIRNITLDDRKSAPRIDGMRPNEERPKMPQRGPRMKPTLLLWVLVGFALLAAGGFATLGFLGNTSVEVTARAHTITFDPAIELTAYPASSSATGSLTYELQKETIEESVVVPAKGTEKVNEKASGNITVYNSYSDSPVRLIKNTRFQSTSGHIFRIASSIEVPGKKGTTPGQVTVTVFADTAGPEYNVPAGKFTIPGLKGTPDMFTQVYGQSSEGFTGGFSGERPAVDPKTLATAQANLRATLKDRAQKKSDFEGKVMLHTLSSTEYSSAPSVSEPGGGVRITERAIVTTPAFTQVDFARFVAQSVTADASSYMITMKPNPDFNINTVGQKLDGSKPIAFTLSGGAVLSWVVDTQKVAQALAGKSEGEFQPTIATFSSIESATANLAPFWRSSFPTNPTDIMVNLKDMGVSRQ